MIQDIAPLHLNNHYDPDARPDADSLVIRFDGDRVIAALEPELHFPRAAAFGKLPELTYLFTVGEERYFLLNEDAGVPEGFAMLPVRELRTGGKQPKHRVFALMTAWHIAAWYRDNRFCGRCGTEMRHSDTERCRCCPACGYHSYPRIMPAVIVGVRDGDRLLLTRYRTGFKHNALIAGFTEIGETAEETVQREVMEEVGLKVKNIRYYKSQPWGIANDLLLGFYCDADGSREIRLDGEELGSGLWTKREDIELQPDDYSLTNEMMRMFKEGKA